MTLWKQALIVVASLWCGMLLGAMFLDRPIGDAFLAIAMASAFAHYPPIWVMASLVFVGVAPLLAALAILNWPRHIPATQP